MKQLDYEKLLEGEWGQQFSPAQREVIQKGVTYGVDVSHYANPEFGADQMWEILTGLARDIDVNHYARPDFHWEQMVFIASELRDGHDVRIYARPDLTPRMMANVATLVDMRLTLLARLLTAWYVICRRVNSAATTRRHNGDAVPRPH